jgi:hypothetical protein
VLVLFAKEEKEISNFIDQTIKNLPNNTPNYINTITRFISVYSTMVTKETKNAEYMFEQLFAANVYGKDKSDIL